MARVTITVEVWWDKKAGNINLVTGDERLTDENKEHPGLWLTVNANPKSADYDPANFNRLARFLADEGFDAPAQVPLKPRHLSKRAQVIAELGVAPGPALKDPKQVCNTCSAYVADPAKHKKATSCV